MFIVLAATNFRLILENMIKYGVRFNPLTFLRTALTPSGAPPLGLGGRTLPLGGRTHAEQGTPPRRGTPPIASRQLRSARIPPRFDVVIPSP